MNKNIKLQTVTVAVSALNEESNIVAFIKSILAQKEDGFVLEKILVISDGSTDKTVKLAKSFKDKRIHVVEHRERKGKSTRLNEIYSFLNTEILVQSDADVVYAHRYVIRNLIKSIIKNDKVGMCGGRPLPIKATTFVEKAINCSFEAYEPLRRELRGGHNKLSADGRILAYRKDLVKKIKIPVNMTSNDVFTYFCALSLGYQYRHAPSAIVYFRSPQQLRDHIKQNTRFLAGPAKMSGYFGKELVSREYHIPLGMIIRNMAKQFIRHPILSTYILLINKYCTIRSRILLNSLTAKWEIAHSTKELRPESSR